MNKFGSNNITNEDDKLIEIMANAANQKRKNKKEKCADQRISEVNNADDILIEIAIDSANRNIRRKIISDEENTK